MVVKPSHGEEEYFAREEAEKKRKLALEQVKQFGTKEKQRLRDEHWMRCPKCGMQLTEITLRGVAVDKCFSCEGVFLDKGELEALAGNEGYIARTLRFFASSGDKKDTE